MSVVHPNKQAFVQGVRLIFSKWTALKLAVSMDWSDDGLSEEKREWFEQVIVDYFGKHAKKVEVDDVEDILIQVMNDEFNTVLEDDSAYMIAKQIFDLFAQVTVGNHSMVTRLQEEATTTVEASVSGNMEEEESEASEEEGSQ